jgi:hypothetical protein
VIRPILFSTATALFVATMPTVSASPAGAQGVVRKLPDRRCGNGGGLPSSLRPRRYRRIRARGTRATLPDRRVLAASPPRSGR